MVDSFLCLIIVVGKGLLVVFWMMRSGEDEVIFVCNLVMKLFEDFFLFFIIFSGEYFNFVIVLVVGGDMLSYKLFVI